MLQATSDVTLVTLQEYWSIIPMSGEVDDLSTVINIQYAGVAIREANFSACGDYATPQKSKLCVEIE